MINNTSDAVLAQYLIGYLGHFELTVLVIFLQALTTTTAYCIHVLAAIARHVNEGVLFHRFCVRMHLL